MKKKFCIPTNTRRLKVGDRIFVRMYSEPNRIGYVESIDEMQDGSLCASIDTRWRKRRKQVEKWYNDHGAGTASQKFCMVFSTSDIWLTNMKLRDAEERLGLGKINQSGFNYLPF